jgi:hypothetical protein
MTDITERLRSGPINVPLAEEAAHTIEDLRAAILLLLNPPRQARSFTLPVPRAVEEGSKGWDFYHTGNMKTGEIRIKLERK